MNDRKERVKDAVSATKAAVEEGIVPGGEVTFIRAARALDTLKLTGDEKVGLDILRHALELPFRWLVKNSGLDDGYYLKLVVESKKPISALMSPMAVSPAPCTNSALLTPPKSPAQPPKRRLRGHHDFDHRSP